MIAYKWGQVYTLDRNACQVVIYQLKWRDP